MLEEKNDNLLKADGNLDHNSVESNQLEPEVLEMESTDSVTAIPAEDNTAPANEVGLIANEPITEAKNQTVLDAIAETNAAESEDETLKERHEIPMQDYDTLSLEALVDELKSLVSNEKSMSFKEHIEEIKKAFLAKYNHLLEEKKEEFQVENQDPNEDFQ